MASALERVIASQQAYDALREQEAECKALAKSLPKGSAERAAAFADLDNIQHELGQVKRDLWRDRVLVMQEKDEAALTRMGADVRLSSALQAAAVRTRRLEAVFNAACEYVDDPRQRELDALTRAVKKTRGW